MLDVPEELKAIVSQQDFSLILSHATEHLKRRKFRNIHLDDGILKYEEDDTHEIQTNFINLVKNILYEKQHSWEEKTKEYLDKFNKDKDFTDAILNDYLKAKEYLTVRLHSESAYKGELPGERIYNHIYATDIPDTYTILALDLPNSFHILTKEEISNWGQSEAYLLEIARHNIRSKIDKIECRKRPWNGTVIYTIFDRDYSASYSIDFKNNCENLIGNLGSIVCLPTKGSVLVHPLSDKEHFNAAFQILAEQADKFYSEDPGPITRNLYWYYSNCFTKFEVVLKDDQMTYTIPKQLLSMLNADPKIGGSLTG